MSKYSIGAGRYDADIKDHLLEWFQENYPNNSWDVKIDIYDTPEDGGGVIFIAWNENARTILRKFIYWY